MHTTVYTKYMNLYKGIVPSSTLNISGLIRTITIRMRTKVYFFARVGFSPRGGRVPYSSLHQSKNEYHLPSNAQGRWLKLNDA